LHTAVAFRPGSLGPRAGSAHSLILTTGWSATPQSPSGTFGYFVLPILCRGELIGRLDAKAHRTDGIFEVKALYAQPGIKWTQNQVHDVALAIVRCAAWHDTPVVQIVRTQPAGLRAALTAAIKSLQRAGGAR
jgi:uncharacterized protein YcaQ